jgi:hypothetical protein
MTEDTIDQDEQTEHVEPTTGELVPVQHTARVVRTVDLRNTATDSWTDVLEDVADLAVKIAGTDFVPHDYRGKPGQVAATVLHGRELGLPPMSALALTNPIKGKPTLSAEGMRSLVLQAGHAIKVAETSGSRCVIRGRRRRDEEWTTVTWTMDDARQAGLLRKSRSGEPTNWEKYPRAMLLARATTELCRIEFPDVIHGMRSAEEMMDEVTATGQIAPPESAEPVKTTTVQRKRAAKKAAAKPDPLNNPEERDVAEGMRRAAEGDPSNPVENHATPPRKRAELPRKTAPAATAAPTDDGKAGAQTPEQPEPADTVEQQQTEIRRLSEERRNLNAADSGPAATDASDDGEVVDAEVVTEPAGGPKMTDRQRGAIMGHWARLGMMQDRDERLLLTSTLLGLEPGAIKSTSELTSGQAVKLLGIIERFKDRDAVDAHLNGQSELL